MGFSKENQLRYDAAVPPCAHPSTARIGIRSNDKKKELFVWARNLTDELNNYSVFTLFNTKYKTYAAPRTFGATFKVRF